MAEWNDLRIDPPGARYRICNTHTGTYIHKSLFQIMEFTTRFEAVQFMKRRGLNRYIYEVEVVV